VKSLKRAGEALHEHWGRLTLASLSAAFYALTSGLFVWLIGPMMITLFQAGSPNPTTPATIPPVVEQSNSWVGSIGRSIVAAKEAAQQFSDDLLTGATREETLVRLCIALISVVTVMNILSYLQGFWMCYIQQAVMKSLRNRLFEKYQRLSMVFFHKQRTGHLLSRVTNDVVMLNDAIDLVFNRLITDGLLVLLYVSFLVLLSWELTFLAAIVLPISLLFIWFIGKKIRKYAARSQERMAEVNTVLEENISNMRLVKAFTTEDREIDKFHQTTDGYFRALVRMTRIRHLASPISDILATGVGVVILLVAGREIISGTGHLSAGDFVTYIFALFSIIKPFKSLTQIHVRLQEGEAAAERIYDILDTPETVASRTDAISKTEFAGAISYQGVSFAYRQDQPVLHDISFEVKRGEVIAIVGPSGSGKSTLVDLLPRFYDPIKGRIMLDGMDIRDLDIRSLRRLMGIVTQETFLFHDTIAQNIAYGLEGATQKGIEEAAKAANAHDFISQFPEGYQSVVGSRGVRLSGGQRQRLAIARALLKNPPILIFDEATSALDSESELQVQEAINRLLKDRTVLVIAHRLSTVTSATRILVLDDGSLKESGTHTELLALNGLYSRLYQLQFRTVE
jgi:subfamily B ATP-binding cassette protein MsbA